MVHITFDTSLENMVLGQSGSYFNPICLIKSSPIISGEDSFSITKNHLVTDLPAMVHLSCTLPSGRFESPKAPPRVSGAARVGVLTPWRAAERTDFLITDTLLPVSNKLSMGARVGESSSRTIRCGRGSCCFLKNWWVKSQVLSAFKYTWLVERSVAG